MNEKYIDWLNNTILSKKKFKFTGEIINGVHQKSDIDYNFKIIGQKKMISVGEYYDYLLISVVITGLNDHLSKLIFDPAPTEEGEVIAKSFENRLYFFYNNLNLDIQNFLNIIGLKNRTTIHELNFNLNKSKKLDESKMSRISKIAVRTTIKDVLNILKTKKSGEFRLPESESGEEYSFTNLPFSYSVDLYLYNDLKNDGFKIEGYFSSDDDVIEIIIKYNPKTLEKHIYNIVGELNDIVSHELEHGFQFTVDGKTNKKGPSKPLAYYTQPDEVKAQRVGFRRLANLRKLPFNTVVKEWFDSHTDIHGLNEHETNKVIKKILNYD